MSELEKGRSGDYGQVFVNTSCTVSCDNIARSSSPDYYYEWRTWASCGTVQAVQTSKSLA